MSENKIQVKTPIVEINLQNIDKAINNIKTTETLDETVSNILSPFSTLLGGIDDQFKFWRIMNLLRLFQIYQQKTGGMKIQIKPEKMKLFHEIFENASKEENENLREKWANLLKNTINYDDVVKSRYINILAELEPIEVKILDSLYRNFYHKENRNLLTIYRQELREMFNLLKEEEEIIFNNFNRFGFINYSYMGAMSGSDNLLINAEKVFLISEFCFDFIHSCQ
jgi:hypothetical protein